MGLCMGRPSSKNKDDFCILLEMGWEADAEALLDALPNDEERKSKWTTKIKDFGCDAKPLLDEGEPAPPTV